MSKRPAWQRKIDRLIPDVDPNELGIREEIVDMEDIFNHLSTAPILVNDFDVSMASERERLNALLYTRHEGETLSNMPKCSCGGTFGRSKLNTIAPCCGTRVSVLTEKGIESLLWLKVPDGIPAFINPQVWRILSKVLTFSGFNLLEYLVNPYYKPTVKTIPRVRKLNELGLPYGLAAFHDHFDEIVQKLHKANFIPADMMDFITYYRDCIFTRVIPFPSKLLFIEERSARSKIVDRQMVPAQEAINILCRLYAGKKLDGDDFVEPELRIKEARCTKVVVFYDKFCRDFERNTLMRKPGVFRKLIGGCLPSDTARGVINSNHDPHRYDRIYIPWPMGVQLLGGDLRSKLLDRDFTPNEIKQLLDENTLKEHILIRSLFDEMLDEAPDGAIPAMFLRNPSLKRGSIQYIPIGGIKDDPTINSITFSILATTAPNADLDGDEMTIMRCLDNNIAEIAKRLEPHLGTMDLNRPHLVSRNVKLPATFISTYAHLVAHHDKYSQFKE